MSRKTFKMLCIGSALVLLVLSLWPKSAKHFQQTGEISSKMMPKEGDNFKVVNNPIVYRLENGRKRQYLSVHSFFADSSNQPFGTAYADGGVLICDTAVVAGIPVGADMPLTAKELANKVNWRRFFFKDKLGHLVIYFFFGLLFLIAFYNNRISVFQYLPYFLVLFSFGLSIEYLQGAITLTRSFEWEDVFMNSCGLLFAFTLFGTMLRDSYLIPIHN